MGYMTSGYRAAHGLPRANHDPAPRYIENPNGDYATLCPRPEFDVPDNPILAAFRTDWYRPEDGLGQEPDVLDYWIDWLDYTAPQLHTVKHIEHARRVLQKLAAVYLDV
jgi:hypothetical protein